MALVVLAGISLALVLSLRGEDGDDREAAGEGPTSTVTAAPTTTTPRVTQVGYLSAYCNAPGLKWPEVPPHVPGEPVRAYARVMELGLDNASDTSSYITTRYPSALGGSTVISPATDNAFTDDPSVLIRTRAVACVTLIGTEEAGVPCMYTEGIVGQVGAQAARNRFAITVYELHSGGILHKGEIVTRASQCPEWAVTGEGGGLVAYGITDQDVLAWFDSHFVDGKPA